VFSLHLLISPGAGVNVYILWRYINVLFTLLTREIEVLLIVYAKGLFIGIAEC